MVSAKPAVPWPTTEQPAAPPAQPISRPGALSVAVLSASTASASAITLRLVAPGTTHAPAPYLPGQFITLAFSMGGETLYRSYSLCGDGRPDAPWEITVKRQPGGRISNELNDHAGPGTPLSASAPQGSFILPADLASGLVFVAGGNGITPIYGMLRALAALPAARRPRATLHYAYRSPDEAIYARELVTLDPRREWLAQYHYVSSAGQRLQPARIAQSAGPNAARAHWYVCGPNGLRREVVAAAARAGVPAARTHREVFTSPAERVVAGSSPAARIRLADSGRTLEARTGETLLETLERCGYKPAFSCRAGACGTCALRTLSGRTRGDESDTLSGRERAAGYVLACCAQPVGDVTLASADGKAGLAVAAWARYAKGKRTLRLTMVAATTAVFLGAWSMTSHPISAATFSSSSSSSSASDVSGSSSSSSSSSASGTSGSSGVITSPSFGQPSTSTGVS